MAVGWVGEGYGIFCMYNGARRDSCNNDFPWLCAETCQKFHLDSFRYICILFRLTAWGGGAANPGNTKLWIHLPISLGIFYLEKNKVCRAKDIQIIICHGNFWYLWKHYYSINTNKRQDNTLIWYKPFFVYQTFRFQ